MPSGLCVVVRHCGGTGNRGLFAPQFTCPGSSWRQGSHLPYTSTGLLRQRRHLTTRKVPGRHVSRRTLCNRGCGTCRVGRFVPLGAAVQRRPRKYSVLTGVAGRAVR